MYLLTYLLTYILNLLTYLLTQSLTHTLTVQSSTLSIRSPFCTWYTPFNFLRISTFIICLKIPKCMTFHKYWTSAVVIVLLLVSAHTLFYLTTHVTASLKLFCMLGGSTALNADPVCHQSGSVSFQFSAVNFRFIVSVVKKGALMCWGNMVSCMILVCSK